MCHLTSGRERACKQSKARARINALSAAHYGGGAPVLMPQVSGLLKQDTWTPANLCDCASPIIRTNPIPTPAYS